jgi:nucleoside-diphosphate-sugar epimerase
LAEEYIQNQELPTGKFYYILRPCMIHGVGNKGNLNLLYNFVDKGIPYPLAAFGNKRSFLTVENLCFVVENLLRKEIPSGIYQVADDEPLSTNEVVKILASSLNKKPILWAIPTTLVRLIAKFGDIIGLPLNTERLNKMTDNYIVSNKRIKDALGISFPISAKEGMLRTAKSFTSLMPLKKK